MPDSVVTWRGHEELTVGLNCSDVFVAPSVDEPFGQVYLEAMACELPVIATDSGGPKSFVNTDPARPNGWRVTPDSEAERQYDWRRIAQHIDRIHSDLLT